MQTPRRSMIRRAGNPAKPAFGAGDPLYLVDPAQFDRASTVHNFLQFVASS
jgi:hypothetical protein